MSGQQLPQPPGAEPFRGPKFVKAKQWDGFVNAPWTRREKKDVTILYNVVERRKSYFFRAYFERHGYRYRDLGDHIKEDVRWGKEWGNRMECNPMYFTSGSLIRNLMKIHREEGLSKEEIVRKFVFLGGGGQCGPCRYGMYPQEYMKVVNDAGFKGFRLLIFTSDIIKGGDRNTAFRFDLAFRINFMIVLALSDLMHCVECALRPYARDKSQALAAIEKSEAVLLDAFRSRLYLITVPLALMKVGRLLRKVPRFSVRLPLIFVTGEFFANLAHNEGNYNLRRFIMDDGCEVIPGLFTQRALYDNWRRIQEATRGIRYAATAQERRLWKTSLRRQRFSNAVISFFYHWYYRALRPDRFGAKGRLLDLDAMAKLGFDYYHPEIFGGEGNLEVAEAIHYADSVDGFISCKPFGCMPSSGVSDGVQAKIISMYPNLNLLSIETSGDNEVNILSRVSMLLFKAKQKVSAEARRERELQKLQVAL
jgi:predicted nucleotide-binding protein (sugar kinase/HSP70/actin superfamily)